MPMAIRETYTYALPDSMPMPAVGARVLVPLGKKVITGIVLREHTEPIAEGIALREIIEVLDVTESVVSEQQLQLWQWMADYYMCTLGEVLAAALPAGILDDNYKARTTTFVRLHEGIDPQQALRDLARAPKQQRVLEVFERVAGCSSPVSTNQSMVRPGDRTSLGASLGSSIGDALRFSPSCEKRLLIEQSGESTAIVRALVERGIFDEYEENTTRLQPFTGNIEPAHPLTAPQQKAKDEIDRYFGYKTLPLREGRGGSSVLLHGVTSSGKTEVYIHLIQEQLQRGKQVLYLVPEIALTTQLTTRLQAVFGSRLLVYHSRFSDAERVEIYHAVRTAQTPIVVLGARSAVFLPLHELGLVIVDEEHEASYKQQEPAPRYHARSVAMMMARWQGAKVLLGSATPSVETYHNAMSGKYGLVRLSERYAGLQLPRISIIDLKRQYHRKEMYDHFSDPLVARMQEVLATGKQVILFQNRRGYAPLLQCTACGQTPRCVNCDVPLTLHMRLQEMTCHYCGYHTPIPAQCPACGGKMRVQGFGTERLEEEVKKLFHEARVMRMDLDTTRNKNAYQQIINAMANHEVDILIGTQMVTKGLHFDDVSLVAVLSADAMLNQPDFRSYERAYQMLEQVAGRAGRKGQQGEVFIQTFEPQNPVLDYVQRHDYEGLFQTQIAEREIFHYPPFYRMIVLVLKHHNLSRLECAARVLQERLRQIFGERVSAVVVPQVSRVRNEYIREIRLRVEAKANIRRAKQLLSEQINFVQSLADCKGTTILADVDPS
ncbi:MAG: primosomal protein N' [Paludibacteraceae bacterium]|nr:primosomal protein N' [Paludibacteraceae bacterium]